MVFPYFAEPERFAAFLEEEAPCDCCQRTRRCFAAAVFYGEETMDAICLGCLAAGQLKSRDIFTCEGDTVELGRQLRALYPAWTTAEVEKAVAEKTEALEKTTPPVISWQDWPWPCADGDYCTFIGYGSQTLYNRLSTDQDGAGLFARSLYYSVSEAVEAAARWATSLPAPEIKDQAASLAYDRLFYVFTSRITGAYVTVWDAA